MDQTEKRRIVEALILSSAEPISATRLAELIPYCKPAKADELVEELNAEYIKHGRAFEICAVAGGYQLRSLPEFAPYLQQILKTRPLRLSQAALETLAIVAYRQPVTRAEVEQIRGVDAGPVLRGLIERKLVRIAGHRDLPGRPMLYATTRRFLEVFELSRLEDLPTLRDLQELAPESALPGAPLPEGTAGGGSEEVQAAGAEAAGDVALAPAPAE
jgi:segregation and condensation protein B